MTGKNDLINGGDGAAQMPATGACLTTEEPEFLPAWYRQLRRSRRLLLAQAAAVAALAVCLSAWSASSGRKLRTTEASVAQAAAEIHQAEIEAKAMSPRKQSVALPLTVEDRLDSDVPPARLIAAIGEQMPPRMTLVRLSVQSDDPSLVKTVPGGIGPADRAATAGAKRLRVWVEALAPSDIEMVTFLTKLTAVPYFRDGSVAYVRDKKDGDHPMRQFAITFTVPLEAAEH